jgi:hypothetical protein
MHAGGPHHDGKTMVEYLLAVAGALWLGIQTSLSPCPLATNIAAISYVGRRVGSPRQILWAGLLYTLGRTLVYLALGMGLVAGLLWAPGLSIGLQKYMNQLLGPVLVLVAMLLLGLIPVGISGPGVGEKLQRWIDVLGVWGAGLLGILFALAFCPVSAALFFLGLIPLAVEMRSGVLVPVVYGLGTALPVLLCAGLIAAGAGWAGQAFHAMAAVELWSRRVAGLLLLLAGIFFILRFLFRVP